MERPTASLTYKGSISDAIREAQTQKKLFVVYISGDDENWLTWEQSIFKEPSVAESVSKYCIFLQLTQGSLDASQFSAIYPQKSIPSISVVGYSGALLWNDGCLRASGGYLDARDFVNKIHEAWVTVHLQETTATVLSAALSSQSHNVASPDSSSSNDPSNSAEKPTEHCEQEQLADPQKSVDQSVCETGNEEKDTKQGKEKYAQSGTIQDREEQSKSATNTSKKGPCSVSQEVDDSVICNDEDVSMETQENILSDESHTAKRTTTCSPASSQITVNKVEEKSEAKKGDGQADCPKTSMDQSESHAKTSEKAEEMAKSSAGSSQISANKMEKRIEAKKGDGLADNSTALKSSDIHLNIRMPNGTAIQATFSKADTLLSVRNYIDENQTSGTGTYDLAVPYPRKVFNEQDMSSSLSELGFASRQSLIVVPRNKTTERPRGLSLNEGGTDSSSNTGGYFQHVKWLLSYVNPLSYLGGNANSSRSEANPNPNLWQYQPNPALQNQLSGTEASRRQFPSNRQIPTMGDNANNPRGRASRPFGSNIHTLNDTEDEGPSGDKNMFWNGNSTQYGGNDNK